MKRIESGYYPVLVWRRKYIEGGDYPIVDTENGKEVFEGGVEKGHHVDRRIVSPAQMNKYCTLIRFKFV